MSEQKISELPEIEVGEIMFLQLPVYLRFKPQSDITPIEFVEIMSKFFNFTIEESRVKELSPSAQRHFDKS